MDSDDSRPGSSASNSSSSSNTSKPASPSFRASRSKSKSSGSRSSSASSDAAPSSPINGRQSISPVANHEIKSVSPIDDANNRSRSQSRESIRSQSSDGSRQSGRNSPTDRSVSRNQSISPARNRSESKSSVSSVSDNDDDKDDLQNGEKRMDGPRAISHEDLSDVSDLESPLSQHDDDEKGDEHENDDDELEKRTITDLRQKLDERKNQLKAIDDEKINTSPTKMEIAEKKNDEDALDFEAEEGECNEIIHEDKSETKEEEKKDTDGEVEEGEELEEGEVSDEDEKRPEETEPKPVCRFYTRGQCTWGMSCRFLHPGVTDTGNYSMFDMVRPVPIPHSGPYPPTGFHDYRNDRPPLHHGMPAHHSGFGAPNRPPVAENASESAWERGLRTAKEMMRKAIKRKEQDMDFEDKKMNLSAAQDELEKDNYYTRDRASPESLQGSPKYLPPKAAHFEAGYSPPPKYPPRVPFGDEYGSPVRYRELPPHRMPQYENDRRIRPAREVIVQREPIGRGDEWNDPWMRSKSPGRGDKRGRRDRRSYSSNSSYSSSSSSRSGSSNSASSRSPSPNAKRRRFNSEQSGGRKSPISARRHAKRSPSPKRRHSPTARRSPPQVGRKRNISPPMQDKRARLSPLSRRKRPSPIASRKSVTNDKRKRRSSSTDSGSSDSSGSESGSSYSSSSSSSTTRRTVVKNAPRSRDKPSIDKKSVTSKKVESSKKRSPVVIPETKASAGTTSTANASSSSSKTTRREELLKQLRAVEDAIARKRSKIT
ncbi:serine/arginine repetitive matrix protein 2 isoform X6 [Bradysia coprophila]|uniref:serine/arginine repetitive matrix protein 2 isoform X6 n=1 Tax=Bradysia coprophila TaxID=38358 RepID=UPI00187DD56E|nr:serine/arginine repetitive matrix protein 2 isoform X6 [Bradysia coprophila]